MKNSFCVKPLVAVVAIMALPSCVSSQEVISLFNGNDLTGWTIHGAELWYVEGGELICERGPDSGYDTWLPRQATRISN